MNNSMSRDITLRRDHGPDSMPGMVDKRWGEADNKSVEYQRQIYNLQTHSHYLEKQLERLLTMNPEL